MGISLKKIISPPKYYIGYCVELSYKCKCYLRENRPEVHTQIHTSFKAASKDGEYIQNHIKMLALCLTVKFMRVRKT